MNVAKTNNISGSVIGASVFASVPAERFYEAVRDVRSFPRWAPGVRRVEVIRDLGEPGMLSEWEISFPGLRKKVSSVLEAAEPPTFLRWTYSGPIVGWGECEDKEQRRLDARRVQDRAEPAGCVATEADA